MTRASLTARQRKLSRNVGGGAAFQGPEAAPSGLLGGGGAAIPLTPVDGGPKPSYAVHMRTTITIRADKTLREVLDKKAAASGKTVSELVREILEEALSEVPLQVRAGHLKGSLRLPRKASEPWRRHLRRSNWRS